MKIMLSTPKTKERREDIQYIPLGLAYLSAVLKKDGHEVKIMDLRAENILESEITKRIRSFNPDFFGVTSTTCQIYESVQLLNLVKAKFPHIKTILGGSHVSALPEKTLKEFPFIDFGLVGEGEITFPEFLSVYSKRGDIEKVKGLVFQKDGKVLFTGHRPYLEDLDSLPFPDRHSFPLKIYERNAIECKKNP